MRLIESAFMMAKAALKQDWKEVSGPNSNPRITEAYSCVDGLGNPEMIDDSKVPWCACFVNYCIQKGIIKGKGTRSAWARSFLDWGVKSSGNVGDIVVLRRGTNASTGHVGFLYEKGTLYIKVLGGNQQNDVSIKSYPRVMVLGYRTSKD